MKRYILFLLLLILFFVPLVLQAQDKEPVYGWNNKLIGGLSFTQSQYENWSEGGVNTLAVTSNLNGKFENIQEKWKRNHNLQLAFGQLKQDSLAFRKAADIIYYQFQIIRNSTKKIKATAVLDARSQFAPSYDYKVVNQPLISEFLAPGYFTQTFGVTYEVSPELNTTIGLGAKETVVRNESLRANFGVNPEDVVRVEAGLNSITKLDKNLAENVNWKSQLGVFVSFLNPDDPTKEWGPDIRWDNIIGMKVNSFMNVNLEVSTLFDRDISDKLQLREVLSVGFVYSFL